MSNDVHKGLSQALSRQTSKESGRQTSKESGEPPVTPAAPVPRLSRSQVQRLNRRLQEFTDVEDVTTVPQFQLNDAIERIGPGPYQLVVLILGGGVYLAEGSLLLMLSIIAKSLIIRWELNVIVAGAIASFIFLGLLLGTICGGFFCDRRGRRLPILLTYFGISVFLFGAFMSLDMMFLIYFKFMLGFALGFGLPAANAVVCESCPATHRSNVYCMTMVMFSLGQLYSATVIWIQSPTLDHHELNWRIMLMWAALPPLLLLIFAYFYLLESPHWLLANNELSKAKEVVKIMASYTDVETKEGFSVEAVAWNVKTPQIPSRLVAPEAFAPSPSESVSSQVEEEETDKSRKAALIRKTKEFLDSLKEDLARLRILFSADFYQTTVLMSYIGFVSNFAYYAMIYGLPDTLKSEMEGGDSKWSPAAGLFFSAIFEIPGVFLAVLLGVTVTRKMNMTIAFSGTAVALVCVCLMMFVEGGLDHKGLIAVFAVKLFIASLFIVVYLYLLECYPTNVRATGLAFCMVVGRLGAFLCPFLYDGLIFLGLSPVWFFVCMLALTTIAAVVSMLLPYETKDDLLLDEAPLPDTKSVTSPPTTGHQEERRVSFQGLIASARSYSARSYSTMTPAEKA
mmetsp:Transcript_102054/g.176055  ORF Transcript_102054/g.176055 Transcript_102054/m.176055 type:complete len:624 (+) Transcript_102054:176-2047(+)